MGDNWVWLIGFLCFNRCVETQGRGRRQNLDVGTYSKLQPLKAGTNL
jgi:hypothetical protein